MEKSVMIVGALALLLAGSFFFSMDNSLEAPRNFNKKEWDAWKAKHNKVYRTKDEEVYRFGVFLKNLEYINANQGETYKLGTNLFSDLTNEEWRALYLLPKGTIKRDPQDEIGHTLTFPEDFEAPTTVNWTQKAGTTNPVLNQGQCGSCWAFSTVESINSAYAVQANVSPIPNLSEQQVVSCSVLYGNLGCNGGNVVPAYKYVMAHPLTTDAQYPYVSGNGKTGFCNSTLQSQGTYKVSSYKTVTSGSCSDLQNSVAQQPTSVCVDASTWQNY
jgi:hypothetical protein